jgi:hypothetical protein
VSFRDRISAVGATLYVNRLISAEREGYFFGLILALALSNWGDGRISAA